MEELRRLHNDSKRSLISKNVRPGDYVLDCGCGRGGDWLKWKKVGAQVVGIDPDAESLLEASERCLDINLDVILQQGDIRDVRLGPFDVICYNFSIHYIVPTIDESAAAIARAVKPGGKLIGITPDCTRIAAFSGVDRLGNTVERVGDQVSVRVADGPFYAAGAKTEPLLEKDVLVNALKPWFDLVEWSPMISQETGLISDIYSKFVFVKHRNGGGGGRR
jgi:ubiquinone/menaquinone biosynthesis C-methylase UbiE